MHDAEEFQFSARFFKFHRPVLRPGTRYTTADSFGSLRGLHSHPKTTAPSSHCPQNATFRQAS